MAGSSHGSSSNEASDLRKVDQDTVGKIDALTEVDRQLFVAALPCFFQRIKARAYWLPALAGNRLEFGAGVRDFHFMVS